MVAIPHALSKMGFSLKRKEFASSETSPFLWQMKKERSDRVVPLSGIFTLSTLKILTWYDTFCILFAFCTGKAFLRDFLLAFVHWISSEMASHDKDKRNILSYKGQMMMIINNSSWLIWVPLWPRDKSIVGRNFLLILA